MSYRIKNLLFKQKINIKIKVKHLYWHYLFSITYNLDKI